MRYVKQDVVNYEELLVEVKNNPIKLAKKTERKYKNAVISVAKQIKEDLEHNRIVLVTGPSASGKTTTSNLLADALVRRGISSVVISMDDFYISTTKRKKINGKIDYESVNALDLDMFKKCMNNLITKSKSKMPRYDFEKGIMLKDEYELFITENTVLIIEGIHAFNPEIISQEMEDKIFRLYVHANTIFFSDYKIITPVTLRFFRRLVRDFHTRGANVARTQKMWEDVIEGEKKYIIPYKHLADKCIDTTHVYEPFIYLEEIGKISGIDADAGTYLTIFETELQFDHRCISKDSLIWEFLGVKE